MESYPIQPSPVSLAEVKPIGDTEGELLRNHEDIQLKVEQPAVNAVTDLWDKNIGTISSSANTENGVFVDVDWGTLSEENRQIATGLGLVDEKDLEPRVAHIAVEFDPDSPVDEIEKALKDAVSGFKHQPLTWAPKYTLEQIKSIYGYGDEEELRPEEVEEYYFAPDGMFHLSEELYEKSLDQANNESLESSSEAVPELSPMSREQFNMVKHSVDERFPSYRFNNSGARERSVALSFSSTARYAEEHAKVGEDISSFRLAMNASLLGALTPESTQRTQIENELQKDLAPEQLSALRNLDRYIRDVRVRPRVEQGEVTQELGLYVQSGIKAAETFRSQPGVDPDRLILALTAYCAGGSSSIDQKDAMLGLLDSVSAKE